MKPRSILAAAGLALALSQSLIAVDLNGTYTGATPLNTLSYEFDAGLQELTLSMTGPDANEFVTEWGFNYEGGPIAGISYTIGGVNATALNIPSDPSLNPLGFDFSISFQNSAGDGRFTTGESIVLTLLNSGGPISAITGSGAHVQGIAAAPNSGKVYSVPEPSSLAAGLVALGMGLGLLRRRMA